MKIPKITLPSEITATSKSNSCKQDPSIAPAEKKQRSVNDVGHLEAIIEGFARSCLLFETTVLNFSMKIIVLNNQMTRRLITDIIGETMRQSEASDQVILLTLLPMF